MNSSALQSLKIAFKTICSSAFEGAQRPLQAAPIRVCGLHPSNTTCQSSGRCYCISEQSTLSSLNRVMEPSLTFLLVGRPPKESRAPSLQGIFYWAPGSQRENCPAPGLHCFLFRTPRAPSLEIQENHHGNCLGSRAPSIQNVGLQRPPFGGSQLGPMIDF